MFLRDTLCWSRGTTLGVEPDPRLSEESLVPGRIRFNKRLSMVSSLLDAVSCNGVASLTDPGSLHDMGFGYRERAILNGCLQKAKRESFRFPVGG